MNDSYVSISNPTLFAILVVITLGVGIFSSVLSVKTRRKMDREFGGDPKELNTTQTEEKKKLYNKLVTIALVNTTVIGAGALAIWNLTLAFS